MISFNHRFHGHNSLRFVYKNGQAERTRQITLKFVANPHRKHSRIAVVISKKVLKSAVGRNRVRRRLYEMIRVKIADLQAPTDIVLLVFSSEVMTMPHDELQQLVDHLFQSVDTYKNTSKGDIIG